MAWKELDKMDQRLSFVIECLENKSSFTDLCNKYDISRKVGYKWKERFLEFGKSGLRDQSKRPNSHPKTISEDTICEIIRLKEKHKNWGPKKIKAIFNNMYGDSPSESSFKRILEKSGLVKKRRIRRTYNNNRISEKIIPEKPNDLWTVDFKGWWMTSDGKKCEPLTVRDDFSKYILTATPLENGKAVSVKRKFKELFRKYGLPKMIKSDNGRPFASVNAPEGLTCLSAWWVSLGIHLDRIRPGHPEENGSHERMHRDLKLDIQKSVYGGINTLKHSLEVWRKEYNNERPHETLNMKFPKDVYKKSKIKYVEISSLEYPVNYMKRKVLNNGQISLNGSLYNISSSIRGHCVGIKPVEENILEVWFDYIKLGIIDIESSIFISGSKQR